jgi:hypothetical protein
MERGNARLREQRGRGEVMKLQLESVEINSVEFSTKTGVSDHVLSINRRELKKFLEEDEHFASVNIELAKPGDPTRIVTWWMLLNPGVRSRAVWTFRGYWGKLSRREKE